MGVLKGSVKEGVLKGFYKYKSIITQPTDINASHRRVVNSCVCFGKQLANFLQIQKPHH
jgi:hypothetical protein